MLKKVLSGIVILFCIIAFAEPVIYRVGVRENLEFLEKGRSERMDLYYPADPRPGDKFPGIVIIHGGSWCRGIRNAEREINIGSNLARMGYVCISIDYRLATPGNLKKYGKTFPVNIQDCKKAVQWLRRNAAQLHLAPAKIGCIGGSAGGHLAALLSVAGPDAGLEPECTGTPVDSSIQACVNLYGVMDFAGFRTNSVISAYRKQVMGSTPQTDRKEWLRFSPVDQVDANDPPMLQIYASADKLVHFRHGELMKQELDRRGVYNEYILLDGFGHVFNLQRWRGKELPKFVRQRVLAFYDRFLKGLSPAEAEKRFVALENFEKAHPEAAYYGVSKLTCGAVEKSGCGISVAFAGKKKLFGAAFDAKFEKLSALPGVDLSAGKTVIVSGQRGADGSLECEKIIFPGRDTRGISGVRGKLRKKGEAWMLEVGKNKMVKLNISAKTRAFRTVLTQLPEIKAGNQVVFLQSRDYGDQHKIFYALFAE